MTVDPVALRATLQQLFESNPAEGVREWVSGYAAAIIAGDLATAGRLVDDPPPLPDPLGALVASHFGPAVAALRSGDRAEAVRRLSFGAPEMTAILEASVSLGQGGVVEPPVSDARRHELNAVWLEQAGVTAAAAAAYYEAGRFYSWDRDLDAALRALERAVRLAPDHAASFWQIADVWLSRSYVPDPPYVERAALDRSLEAWTRGSELASPDAPMSWIYVTRALIAEQQGRLDDGRRETFWWEAAISLERALLLDDTDALRWAFLARMYRMLDNEACAYHAVRQAAGRSADEPTVLEEQAAVLANMGLFDEAKAAIDKRLAQDANNMWAVGIKAYVHLHQGDYAAALELIDRVIAADPHGLWNLGVRGAICQLMGDPSGARAAVEAIWSRYSPALPADDRRSCALAAYRLGRFDEAIAILEPLVGERLQHAYTLRGLGMCYLAKGELGRGEPLVLSGLARATAREIDDFVAEDLAGIESIAPRWIETPGGPESLARVKRTAAALAAELRRMSAPEPAAAAEAELQFLLHAMAGADGPAATAVRAALGRLRMASDRLTEASAVYRELSGRIPEGAAGARRALERLGDELLKAGRADEALARFEDALAGADGVAAAELQARAALARQQQNASADARSLYLGAMRAFREIDPAEPGDRLARVARPLLRGVADYWAVDTEWQVLAGDPDAHVSAAFTRARAELSRFLDDLFGLDRHDDPAAALPFVTPISLEVASPLVPLVDPNQDGGQFITKDIAAMRDRIAASVGFAVPGIRVRENPGLNDGEQQPGSATYTLLLDEVPIASGRVQVGSKYFVIAPEELAAANLPAEGTVDARHPATGLPGAWCPSACWEALSARGLLPQGETAFILSHVEHVLRQHLPHFLGVDETQVLLDGRQKEPAHAAFAAAVSGDERARLALWRALRALVGEQVPITDWSRIIDAIGSRDLTDVDEVVRLVRLGLRDQLPGNRPSTTLVPVPQAWEDHVRPVGGGGPRFAVSPSEAHQMIVEVRARLAAVAEPAALVTPTPALRSLVRRLTAYEFPTVTVLSQDEVSSGPITGSTVVSESAADTPPTGA